MRIVVLIKQVPETKSVKMDEETGTVIREGVESIVNPLDLYAIEVAISLKNQYGGKTVAVSMGPPKADICIKEALSMGIDKGVLISDRAFAGSDTWATAYILGEAVKFLGDVDMIICGERATDGDTGQVGPEVAAHLKIPVASYVNKIYSVSDGRISLSRQVEQGDELLDVKLPCLLTVVKEIATPRLPTLDGKIRAKATQLDVITADMLQLNPDYIGLNGSPTRVAKIFRPKVTRECELIFGKDDEAIHDGVEKVFSFLDSREVL
jgi:electron transfer flavoprotein beta subunit